MKNYKWLILFIVLATLGSFLVFRYISSNTTTKSNLQTFLKNKALCYEYIKDDTSKNELLNNFRNSSLLNNIKDNGYIISYHSPQQDKIISTIWIPTNKNYSLKKDSTISGEWTKNLLTIKTIKDKKIFAFAGKNFVALSECGNCLVEITKHITLKPSIFKHVKENTLYGNLNNINKLLSDKNKNNIFLKLITKGIFAITKQGNKNGLFYQAQIDSLSAKINNTPTKFPKVITKNTIVAITLNQENNNTLNINSSANKLWDIEEKYQINIQTLFKTWFTGTVSYVLLDNKELSEIAIFNMKPNAVPYEQMPELFITENSSFEYSDNIQTEIKRLRIKDLSKVIFKQTDVNASLYTTIYNNKFIVCNSKSALAQYTNQLAGNKSKRCSYSNISDFGYYVNSRLLFDAYFTQNALYSKSFTRLASQILSKTSYILGEGLFSDNKILIQGSIKLRN